MPKHNPLKKNPPQVTCKFMFQTEMETKRQNVRTAALERHWKTASAEDSPYGMMQYSK